MGTKRKGWVTQRLINILKMSSRIIEIIMIFVFLSIFCSNYILMTFQ